MIDHYKFNSLVLKIKIKGEYIVNTINFDAVNTTLKLKLFKKQVREYLKKRFKNFIQKIIKPRIKILISKDKKRAIVILGGLLELIPTAQQQQAIVASLNFVDDRSINEEFSLDDVEFRADKWYISVDKCCNLGDGKNYLKFIECNNFIEITFNEFWVCMEKYKVEILQTILALTFGQNYQDIILNYFNNIECKPKRIEKWYGTVNEINNSNNEWVTIKTNRIG